MKLCEAFKNIKDDISGNCSHAIEAQMLNENIRALKLMGTLAVASAGFNLLIPAAEDFTDMSLYRSIHVAALVINAAALIFLYSGIKKTKLSPRQIHFLMGMYTLMISIMGGMIAIIDTRNGGGFISFLTTQVLIFGLVLMVPYRAAVLCGIHFIVFLIAVTYIADFPVSKYIETLLFYITVIAVAAFRYRSAVTKFNDTEMIMDENSRLSELTVTDGLTGAQNRMGLRRDFEQITPERLFVMMCDIDHFKIENDVYGHSAGDEALRNLAFVLGSRFGREHVYRYGGDEFLVIIPSVEKEKFEKNVSRARKDYFDMRPAGAGHLTFSCGYVYGECPDKTVLRKMIEAADAMLYKAKTEGRDRVFGEKFTPEAGAPG